MVWMGCPRRPILAVDYSASIMLDHTTARQAPYCLASTTSRCRHTVYAWASIAWQTTTVWQWWCFHDDAN
jgi:hypothetical protein